jgi:hypothetical protein
MKSHLSRRAKSLVLVAALVVASSCAPAEPESVSTSTTSIVATDLTCNQVFPTTEIALPIGELSEVYGVVSSRSHPGTIWIAGRVRDETRFWAVSGEGEALGSVLVPGIPEPVVDLAMGPAAHGDGDAFYLALETREPGQSELKIARIGEPDPTGSVIEAGAEFLRYTGYLSMPTKVALLIDRVNEDLVLVGQRGNKSILLSGSVWGDHFSEVAAVKRRVTQAGISDNGGSIFMRTPLDVVVWSREPDAGVAEAVSGPPCVGLLAGSGSPAVMGFGPGGEVLYGVRPGLTPTLVRYAIPWMGGPRQDLDGTRAGSVSPEVVITEPQSDLTAVDGVALRAVAVVDDDGPLDSTRIRWRVESRHCPADQACEITKVVLERGSSLEVVPSGAEESASELLIEVTYEDEFGLKAGDSVTLDFRLPDPVPGSSVRFIGGSVEIGQLDDLAGDMTLEMWVKPEDLSTRRILLGKAYSGEGLMIHEPDGTVNFYHGEAGGNCCDGSYMGFNSIAVLPVDEWSHVVLTRAVRGDGGTLRFFINGTETNTGSMYRSPSLSTLPWLIGRGHKPAFSGGIDEVAIYDRVLAPTDIAAHFTSIDDPATYGRVVLDDDPIGYWRLDEPGGKLARDETGVFDGTYSTGLTLGQPGARRE